jgi:hypothetical protein
LGAAAQHSHANTLAFSAPAINTRWVRKKSGINHQHTATRRWNKNANCHQRAADRRKSKEIKGKKRSQSSTNSLCIINLPAEVQLAAIGNFLGRTSFTAPARV